MLGIAQASLALLSLTRNFLNAAEKNVGSTIKLFFSRKEQLV